MPSACFPVVIGPARLHSALGLKSMTPDEFKAQWEREKTSQLLRYPRSVVHQLAIPEEAKSFLTDIGLPEGAAPFLDFGGSSHISIPTVTEVWKAGEPRYRVIGSNGYGDPVCVDTESAGRVLYLLHDDEMAPRFMNSSIPQLAYSLLAFRQVVADTNAIGGKDAYLEGRIPPEVVDRFIVEMETIDPPAIASESFWFHSIVGEGI
jgi:hypothetical protein